MKKSALSFTVMIISSVVLGATTGFADSSSSAPAEANTQESVSSTEKVETSESKTATTATSSSETTKTTTESSSAESLEKTKVKHVKQKFYIQKIIAKETVDNNGKKQQFEQGVNGASFKVYEITDMLKDLPEVDMKNDVEKIQAELTDRAKKIDLSNFNQIAEGVTSEKNGQEGVFEFETPESEEKHQAFWVVNDEVEGNTATLSEPFLILTPITDDDGNALSEVWIYPKSQPIEEKKVVRQLPSTGGKLTFFQKVVNFFTDLF